MYAQNDGAGNTGLSFLKLGVTSRSIAMGDAVVSYIDDASASHYNPSSLMMGKNNSIVFMHNENILGIRTEFLAAKVKFQNFAFGLHLNNTSVSDIEVREIPGAPLDKFTAQNFAFGISAAYKINDMISAGITGKFIYEKIYIDNASGFAVDFGGLYTYRDISFGLSISNIGSMSNLRSEATKLPTLVRAGGSYMFNFPSIYGGLRIAIDGFKVFDGGKFHIHSGAEFSYKDFLLVRAGYQTGYEDKSFTTGIGLKYKMFNLDYAFVPYKYSLGSSHTITLGASF